MMHFSILGRLPWRKQVVREERRMQLGFCIDSPAEGRVIETSDSLIPRRIVLSGKTPHYVMETVPAAGGGAMERAKANVIDTMAGEDAELGSAAFARAACLAEASLAGSFEGRQLKQAAHIVAHDTAGFGPISLLLENKEAIEEIEINSPGAPIAVYHVKHGRCTTNLRFSSYPSFRSCMNRFILESGKELNDEMPIIDAQVADARVHAQIRPYAASGASASIRIGGKKDIYIPYMIRNGTSTGDVFAYLWIAMEAGMNIIFAGPPASGKTTMLSSCLAFAGRQKRIVTIEEEIGEFRNYSGTLSIVPLYGSASQGAAADAKSPAINPLRRRPDIKVKGEIRGEEARELLSSGNTGIQFLTTMHSSGSGEQLLNRLAVKPMSVEPRSLSAVDIAVYMESRDHSEKRVVKVSEYMWLSKGEDCGGQTRIGDDAFGIRDIADNACISAKAMKGSKAVARYAQQEGMSVGAAIEEMKRRKEFLGRLAEGNVPQLKALEEIYGFE